eukprot:4344916-Prymnesium_polylepis.6
MELCKAPEAVAAEFELVRGFLHRVGPWIAKVARQANTGEEDELARSRRNALRNEDSLTAPLHRDINLRRHHHLAVGEHLKPEALHTHPERELWRRLQVVALRGAHWRAALFLNLPRGARPEDGSVCGGHWSVTIVLALVVVAFGVAQTVGKHVCLAALDGIAKRSLIAGHRARRRRERRAVHVDSTVVAVGARRAKPERAIEAANAIVAGAPPSTSDGVVACVDTQARRSSGW